METKEEILRIIIYWWRRYGGVRHKDTSGKFYNFGEIDLLEKRIDAYFKNPEKFDFNKPEMGTGDYGEEEKSGNR